MYRNKSQKSSGHLALLNVIKFNNPQTTGELIHINTQGQSLSLNILYKTCQNIHKTILRPEYMQPHNMGALKVYNL